MRSEEAVQRRIERRLELGAAYKPGNCSCPAGGYCLILCQVQARPAPERLRAPPPAQAVKQESKQEVKEEVVERPSSSQDGASSCH